MQIEKNISATLKDMMKKRGETATKFSAAMDIPRSTLQGYLKGTSCPRADSIEELAGKLRISPAELVSGAWCAHEDGISCLDPAILEIQALHPKVKSIAEGAVTLLRSVFRMSDDLYDTEPRGETERRGDERYRYFLHEMRDPCRRTTSYGLLVKEHLEGQWITVAVVAAISRDRAAVSRLALRCTSLQLSPEHLLDVVHDFLAQDGSPE